MVFDPFASGGATEVTDKPSQGPASSFDPFASGKATAQEPLPDENTPRADSDWKTLYGGIDNLDKVLPADQRAAFSHLDSVSENPKEARAQAINEAYLGTQLKGMSPGYIHQNYDAVSTAYAKERFGIVSKSVPATGLYGQIAKVLNPENEAETGEVKPWTLSDAFGSDVYETKKALGGFWEGINKPIVELPDAPHDLYDAPEMGMGNPALVGGVYNAVKPLIEGVESPLGLVTLGVGTELQALGKAYPIAKVILGSMTGVFTGIMGYQTAKQVIAAPKVLKDPTASFEDRVTAVAKPVADFGATLLSAIGTAFELWPGEKQAEVAKEMQGKNPAEAAQVLRTEAEETDIPHQNDFLNDAARHLESIAKTEDLEAAKEAKQAKEKPQKHPKGENPQSDEQKPAESPVLTEKGNPIGIKNAVLSDLMAKMGYPEPDSAESLTFKGVVSDVSAEWAKDPDIGKRLVAELEKANRAPTPREDVILGFEANRLRNESDAASKALFEAQDADEAAKEGAARSELNRLGDEFAKMAAIDRRAGTASGQSLAFRKVMIAEDYSYAGMEQKRRVAAGKSFSEADRAEIQKLHKQLADAEAKVADFERQRREAAAAPVREAPRRPKPPGRVEKFISDQAAEARKRILERAKGQRIMDITDIPAAAGDLAIVGAEYISKGVRELGEWSKAMVNEFGESIRPYLQDLFKQSIAAEDAGRREQKYIARKTSEIEKGKAKLASGDTAPKPRNAPYMSKEAQKLRSEAERVKRKIQLRNMQREAEQRTLPEKAKDLALAFNRAGVLSRVAIIAKLSAIIAERAVMTPIRQTIGYAVGKVLPGVAAQGRFEAVDTFGGLVRSEAKAFVAIWTKGIPGAWEILKMKDTDLQALLGKEHLAPGALEYPWHIHAALHYPIQVSDYVRRLSLITERDMRAGIDMKEPINQMRDMQEAWEYSKRSIFLQDNKLVSAYQAGLKILAGKEKSGAFDPIGKMLSFALQAENPVVRVPVNLAEEVTEHILGLVDPPARLAIKGVGGFKGLSYGEADMILRHIKNGSLGAALVLLGFFKYKQVGGFYEGGEKRKKNDVQPGEARVGGTVIPANALKDTSMEAIMAGATMHRTLDSVYRLNDPKKKGIPAAVLAVAAGIADDNPFIRNASILGKILDPRERENAVAADIANHLVPGLVQEIAAETDKTHPARIMDKPNPRKITAPDFEGALKQNLEKEIPGLREKLTKRFNPYE